MKKTPLNELKIAFPSLSANEGVARSVAGIFLSQLNPTLEELADVKCAVSEAVTNAIVHGYKNSFGTVTMTMRILPDRVFRIEIKDSGIGIGDIKQAMEPLFTTDPESERSGMGFPIMESFMDTVKVRSVLGKGCRVIMTKKLSAVKRLKDLTIHN